jgi:hypothetical protein
VDSRVGDVRDDLRGGGGVGVRGVVCFRERAGWAELGAANEAKAVAEGGGGV